MKRCIVLIAATLVSHSALAQSFVNWESPHGNPLDITPDGNYLLAVNTADNRLEVFSVSAAGLSHLASVPVGLDPVSVRALSSQEAWVVNHISDSVSVVDLQTLNVVATLYTGDEPADVEFAGDPLRAFVSVSQLNQVKVFDPADLTAAPIVLDIAGEDPRALATDGQSVYVALFESGNNSTILAQTTVSSAVNPYAGDPNPPPNDGDNFFPPIAGDLPVPPEVGLVVKKDESGNWLDDNGADWSAAVTWDLHDHDVAIIDAETLAVSYVSGLMNANMNLGVSPSGEVVVIGTDGINHVRFEPNIAGVFVRVLGASFLPPAGAADALVDLNPHLDYSVPNIDAALREQSLGDPRGIAFNEAGDRAYITGMGSNNLIVVDAALSRLDRLEVGLGPTGVCFDSNHELIYVLNKFEGSISVVAADGLTEIQRLEYYDPSPPAVTEGRVLLYGTHETSGLGQAACASCHIDGRMDQLAWDLGNPAGEVKPFNQTCNFGLAGGCEDWHPMKGPMTTQTLFGIIGTEPLHWRGDREDLAAFNVAFEALMGADGPLSDQEMDQFEAFVATLTPPPNPLRRIDGTLQAVPLTNGGTPTVGSNLFTTIPLDGGVATCAQCHAPPSGTIGQLTSADLLQETQSMKIPQLRNLYEKTGFLQSALDNNRGFGFIHDGSVPSIFEFLQFSGFNFAAGDAGDQQRRDIEAFLLSFATDTHAGVGVQATIGGAGDDQALLRDQMIAIAEGGAVGLVVKGVVEQEQRGYVYLGSGNYQSDRMDEQVTTGELDEAAQVAALTYTLVPGGSQTRIGIDRDADGFYDRDELDACANPSDPLDYPGSNTCPADLNVDGQVDVTDLLALLAQWGTAGDADVDCSGSVGVQDLLALIAAWGPC